MNARERYLALMNFELVDRTFFWDFGYWAPTVRRWYAEGLPLVEGIPQNIGEGKSIWGEFAGVPAGGVAAPDVRNYVKNDPPLVRVPLKIGAYPPFEQKVIEDHGDWHIYQDPEGYLKKELKEKGGVWSFVGSPVKNRKDWETYKAERLQPTLEGRLPANWPQLVDAYKTRDYPLGLGQVSGFFSTPRRLMGVEALLTAYYDDPDMMRDMNSYLADFWIALCDPVLSRVKVDAFFIHEDMAYKKGSFVSPAMFREFIMPGLKKLTGFLREHGVTIVNVDSDGNLWKLIPLWIEGGVNVLYPFEVDAGMDVVEVRKAFPKLGIIGGIQKLALAQGKQAIDWELESKLPFMLSHGGYIPSPDHMVQPNVSLEDFVYYKHKVRELVENNSRGGHS